MLSGSTASKPFFAHMEIRLSISGSRTSVRRMSSQRSPFQPLPLPRTAVGNLAASGRNSSQAPVDR